MVLTSAGWMGTIHSRESCVLDEDQSEAQKISPMKDLMRTVTDDVGGSLDGVTLATGAVIVGGLLLVSYLLYMFDTWATSRIGDMLLDHYGPAMYSKMTSEFDPVGLAALDSQLEADDRAKSDRFGGQFAGWSDEDVIRAYLLQQLRRSDPAITAVSDPAAKYLQPMKPMFLSSKELAGY